MILACLFSANVDAQSKFAINYSFGIPTSETSDLFGETSWRGVNLDFSYFLEENIAIGFSGGWQVFDDGLGYVTETDGTETISGQRYNYLNSVPLFFTGSYYLNTDAFSPYLSLGIGGVYNQLEEDIGLFSFEEDQLQFALRPELGLDYEFYYGFEIRAAVRYHYVFEGGDLPNLSYLGIVLGLVWSN
ncbi:porin family protein [Gramella lutea]|uniref:Porin family protein n=2 Tax=Christiangramia lutea TaxID=1607951 RepID=A0A9X2AA63_9FLAO|nr:porin family protein [Christiangramia lutea]